MPFGNREKEAMGPTQGGKDHPPKSLFRNDWKRGPQYAGSGPVHEHAVQSHAEDHRLEDLLHAMENSKTSRHRSLAGFFGKKNSQEYTSVMDGLRSVLVHTKVPFKFDSRTNAERAKNVADAYFKLIHACEVYIAKPGGEEGAGLARKNMVRSVLELARQDIVGVQQCYFDIYSRKISESEQERLTWDKVIAGAREATIEVDDLHNDAVFKPLGAEKKKGDKASRLMGAGVFTKEEKESISGNGKTASSFGDMTAFTDTKNNEGDYGTETNITNRNVATSRMAGLLGLSDLIAESKTVNVKDKKTGQTFKGNMMALAKGNAGETESFAIRDQILQFKSLEEREKKVQAAFAPAVQKQLTSLQVLDYICGQNDRHSNNFFLDKDKDGKLAKVTGIDNDQSFSTGIDFAKRIGDAGFNSDRMRPVVGKNKELVIPYMDKQLASNILNLKPDVVRFALQDLLAPKYVENTIERLKMVQEAIRNEPQDSPRFRNADEWNEETAHNMLQKTRIMKQYEMMKQKGISWTYASAQSKWDDYKESTYFGEFMANSMGFVSGFGGNGGRWLDLD